MKFLRLFFIPGIILITASGLSGCNAGYSTLAPVTPEAAGIARIWWIFFFVCLVVYGLVMGFVFGAWVRRRGSPEVSPLAPLVIEPPAECRTHRVLGLATAATALILLGLLVADLWVQRGIAPRDDNPLVIKLTGHQWWWNAEYQNSDPSQVFETANELHVPTGRSVRLLLESGDVIHSFWIPRVHGKKDLVPGHPTSLTFRVDQPGQFQGQCAEFCGYQHAHMGILLVVEKPEKFATWARGQQAEAPEPTTDAQRRGREIVEQKTCAMCHTVRGTTAGSRVGPALTHFASRQTLAAGTAANARDVLSKWISDPNALKPGTRMPATPLSDGDRDALLDYLETLK